MVLATVGELFSISVGAFLGCSLLRCTFPCPLRKRLWQFSWQLSRSEITSLVIAAFRFLIADNSSEKDPFFLLREGIFYFPQYHLIFSQPWHWTACTWLNQMQWFPLAAWSLCWCLLVFSRNYPPDGQAQICKRMQLLLHNHYNLGNTGYNRILFHIQHLFSVQMLVWRALWKMWVINSAMSGRATAEAILCATIKWRFLALRAVESWPVIIMWKIILNPPGQSPQTAGRVYPETKKNHIEKCCLWYCYSECEPKPWK